MARPNNRSETLHANEIAPVKSKGSRFAAEPRKLSGGNSTRAAPQPTKASAAETKKI